MRYYGGRIDGAPVCYVVQPRPCGFCDALFRAAPLMRDDESLIVGLPDTVWFPRNGLLSLPDAPLSFLLFPVDSPQFFDAVLAEEEGRVIRIEVKQDNPGTHWIWGAFRLSGEVFHQLWHLWTAQSTPPEYWGTLINSYLESGVPPLR